MKRFLTYAALTLILTFGITWLAFPQFVTNTISLVRIQSTALVFTAVQTFNAAIDVSGSDIAVDEGQRFDMEGLTGDTYHSRTADTSSIDTYVDGTLTTTTTADQWQPPPCPSDLNTVAAGRFCYEATTNKIHHRGTLEVIP